MTDVPALPRKSYLRKNHIKVFWHHFPLQRRDDITSVDVSGKKDLQQFLHPKGFMRHLAWFGDFVSYNRFLTSKGCGLSGYWLTSHKDGPLPGQRPLLQPPAHYSLVGNSSRRRWLHCLQPRVHA